MKKNLLAYAALLLAALFLVYGYGCKKANNSNNSDYYFSDTSAHPGGASMSSVGAIKFPLAESLPSPLPPLGLKTTSGPVSLNVPPPGNQGSLESCAGWAVGYGMLSYEYKLLKHNSGYSDDTDFFSPLYTWNQLNSGGNNPIRIDAALQIVQLQGCCKWPYMPGDIISFTEQPSYEALLNASSYKIASIYQFGFVDLPLMKSWLVDSFPIMIGVVFDKGFQKGRKSTNSFKKLSDGRYVWNNISSDSGDIVGGHYLLICGYDDAINAFEALNSWGTGWGNQGHIWIDYNFLNSVVMKDGGTPQIYVAALQIPNAFFGTQAQGTPTYFTANAPTPYSFYLSAADLALNVQLDATSQHVLNAIFEHHFAASGLPTGGTFQDAQVDGNMVNASINSGIVTINFAGANFVGTISGNSINGTYTDSASFTDVSGYVTYPIILSESIALTKQ